MITVQEVSGRRVKTDAANTFTVEPSGMLVIREGNKVVAAHAPGQWSSVHIVEAQEEES